ncbi:MAG: mannose-6-phosphate isomerase [Lachnospiraceae bacterium]|nr:mannose-6-phosphate isomerase [Lachnospiraceae bacterium]
MKGLGKYHNYDLHPIKRIEGFDDQAWEGTEAIGQILLERVRSVLHRQKKAVVCFDMYPGVKKEEILSLGEALYPVCVFDMENYAKTEDEINEIFADYITEDRVFGVMCHKRIDAFFEQERLKQARKDLEMIREGCVVVLGMGAGILTEGDIYVYCNLTRWEIQLRYRKGMPNWHCTNTDAPILAKYKRGFFIEWRLADRHKRDRYDHFDFMLDTEEPGYPKLITGDAFRSALNCTSREPFRMEPYFDPGVWGGHWMQENFGLDPEQENFAWSFDGVPEENSLIFGFGEVSVKVPAIDLVFYRPRELLGERVHGRFGAEFPIRFDLLDTMGGGNLSLQVHPLTEYIQDTFGMHYTQDESYYLLDTDSSKETYVYLGLQKDIDREAMARDLKAAETGEILFPAEKYVNMVPVKKHDHVLIPAGTIHCSGKDTMVLEISATPYIFTFKLWDWGRVGLDGIPRPIHIEHGLKNIQWDRDTDWIYHNVVGRQKTVEEGNGYKIERTGLHEREFLDTFRYTVSDSLTVMQEDSVHVMNLVEGSHAWIESVDDSFRPFEIHYAETVIVPAKTGTYKIVSDHERIMLIVASIRK